MVDGNSNLGMQYVCSNLIYSKEAALALQKVQEYAQKENLSKETTDKVI